MAAVLSLKWSSTTVSLLAAKDAGWRHVSWRPKSGDYESEAPVVEVINLQADHTSDDNLATTLQSLDEMRKWAVRYMNDPTSEYPVWLHAQMTGETGERRALVRKITLEWASDPMPVRDEAAAHIAKVRVKIEREPWWEHTTGNALPAKAESAGASLTYGVTAGGSPTTIAGDDPARIQKFAIGSDATGARVGRLWMGMRGATKHGTLANFVPIWECEDGANNAGESGLSDEAADDVNGASPGSGSGVFVELTPTDLDWDTITNGGAADAFLEVCEIEIQDVSANTTDQLGDYLWLLRYKLASNASTWEVQFRWGYSGMADADYVQGEKREVSSTSWEFEDQMGRHMLQVSGRATYPGDQKYNAVQLWARRTSGAADIHFDCICLIPLDEGWLKIWGMDLAAGAAEFLGFGENPDGNMAAYEYDAGGIQAIAAVAGNRFRLPVGECDMIIVYAGPTGSDITTGGIAVLNLSNAFFERWGNLRGGE